MLKLHQDITDVVNNGDTWTCEEIAQVFKLNLHHTQKIMGLLVQRGYIGRTERVIKKVYHAKT